MVVMFTSRLAARPRRSLLIVLLFVVVAGVLGGPVAGALKSSGGFVAPGADSEVAIDRIEAATGREADAGIVLLVAAPTRARLAATAQRLHAVPGIASTATGDGGLVTGVLRADADDDTVAQDALDAFAGKRGITVGGPAVASKQIGETVGADLGRAELIAFPFLVVLSLLFFRGRAALMPVLVGVTTVLGTFLVLAGGSTTRCFWSAAIARSSRRMERRRRRSGRRWRAPVAPSRSPPPPSRSH